ncbi:PepSY domain-containing protein [Cytobacillus purgationiresistens]|uniref:Membrane protein YkoI n=1 Tax=Cytobacillus purgationiresistens TaxID=863449 RepID=A0ABU0AA65_9BACI|nr:PepSY domain-containing protein [Cytobacillus purgationiresistens]MDQ0268134.1 putative membrane protein YkoI [Cytobacillus purgationiresistens]
MKKWTIFMSIPFLMLVLVSCNTGDNQTAENENGNKTEQNSKKPDLNNENLSIDFNEAIDEFSNAYPDASITKVELDSDLNVWKYEISGVDDTTEYEIEINTDSKVVKKQKEEALDKDETNGIERENKQLDLDAVILPEKAIEAVSKETEDEIDGWTLERENSGTYYEVTVRNGNSDTDYIVDAMTGEIVKKDN